MNGARWERGAGKLGTIVGLIILVVAIVFAVKYFPARVKVFQLKDTAEQAARHLGTAQIRTAEEAIKLILDEAKDLEIKITEKNVTVTEGNRSFYIELKYTYPVDFIVYTWNWQIDQKVEGVKVSV